MTENQKIEKKKRRTKYIFLGITVIFILSMLVIPLIFILTSALREGIEFYLKSVTTEYVKHALGVTILATLIALIVNTFFGICASWL